MKKTIVAAWLAAFGGYAAEFHVAVNGTAGGTGSASAPWDMATALKHPASVLPGDTIWVHEGIYRAPAGNLLTGGFKSSLKGAPGKPIIFRAAPGERAIIDGRDAAYVFVFTINGAWTWYWGLEVISSDPNRRATTNASNGPGTRGAGLVINGPNVKVINSIIHDSGTAIGFWEPAVDSELYGNIIYNNGWISPQRAHGHGTYAQNLDGAKKIRDNIYFNQLAGGLQIYGTSEAYLRNFLVKGNVIFNDDFAADGGNQGVWNLLFSDNMLYNANCGFMDHVNVGKSLRIENNYFGLVTPGIAKVDRAEVVGNTFIRRPGATLAIDIGVAAGTKITDHLYDGNTYQVTSKEGRLIKVADAALKLSNTYTLPQMQQQGLEKTGQTFVADTMTGSKIFVRPNEFDPARAHLVIYNWSKENSVMADLSTLGIRKGDRYEIRNVQNYFLEKLTGIYNGTPIRVPMTGWSISRPIGLEEPVLPSTFPGFGVFLLTWKKAAAPPAVNSSASKWLPVASGSIAEALGEGFASDTFSASGLPVAELGGTSLKIRDAAGKEHAAPLYAVSPGKITFQVPGAVVSGYAQASILQAGREVAAAQLMAYAVAPGLFTATGDGTGPALCNMTITFPDTTAETRPCSRCDAATGLCEALPVELTGNEVTLSLYGTGFRNAASGSISVRIGPETLTPDAVASLAEFPGLDLVNVRLPATLAGSGESDVVLTAEGTGANPVKVNLQ